MHGKIYCMILTSAQLPAHLEGPLGGLKNLYTLHGDELLLVQEAGDMLRAIARKNGHTERTVHVAAGAHFDWSAVVASGAERSLFADRQLIEIRIPGGKPGTTGSTALQQIAARAAQDADTLTLVLLPRLDGTATKSAWFTALGNAGVTVKFDTIERPQLPQWIARRLQLQGQRVASGEEGVRTLEFFADRVEGNLLAAHQEIQKLALLYPPADNGKNAADSADSSHPAGILGFEQVQNAVLNVARYTTAKLSEAALAGQRLRTARVLDGLQAEGESDVFALWALSEDIRNLKRVQDALDAGRPMPMALRESRVWGVKEKLYERALTHLDSQKLVQLLQAAHKVDGITKGLKQPDWPNAGWQALQRLASMLCAACAVPQRSGSSSNKPASQGSAAGAAEKSTPR